MEAEHNGALVVGFGWKRWHAGRRKSCASEELNAIAKGQSCGSSPHRGAGRRLAVGSLYGCTAHTCTYMCRRGIVPSPTHVTRRPTAALGSSPQHNLLLPHYKPPFAPSPPSPIIITITIITIIIITIIIIILGFEVSSLPSPKKPPSLYPLVQSHLFRTSNIKFLWLIIILKLQPSDCVFHAFTALPSSR